MKLFGNFREGFGGAGFGVRGRGRGFHTPSQNVSVILIEDLTPLQQLNEDVEDYRNSLDKRKVDIDPICSCDLDCQDSSKHSFLAIPCLNLRPPDSLSWSLQLSRDFRYRFCEY